MKEETGKKQEQPALSAQDLEEQKKKMMEEMKKLKNTLPIETEKRGDIEWNRSADP